MEPPSSWRSDRPDLAVVAHNLRRLRLARDLTQAELAERTGMSRVFYSQLEGGKATPSLEALGRLGRALGVKLGELVAEARPLQAVRFRAQKRMTSRAEVLVQVARWLDGYRELEELLGEAPRARLRELVPARRRGNARASAEAARAALGLGAGESIRDICGLVEDRAGIKVFPLALASEGFFGLSVAEGDGGPAIVVNAWERISVERWIFTAAHELGHLLLHLGAYDVARADEDGDEEREADQFASHFLMPADAFAAEWEESRGLELVDRVLKVKRIFRVSYRTVLYRLVETTTSGADIWRRFQVEWQERRGRTLKRADEPEALGPRDFHAVMVEPRAADEPARLGATEFVEDRLSRLVRAAVERDLISLGRAAEILGIDLKTMRRRAASWVE